VCAYFNRMVLEEKPRLFGVVEGSTVDSERPEAERETMIIMV